APRGARILPERRDNPTLKLPDLSLNCREPALSSTVSDGSTSVFIFIREARVIRSFLSNDNVVRVAFLNRRAGDLDEAGFGPQLFDGPSPAVPHPRAKAADELEDEVGEWPLVGDAAFDAFGDELLGGASLGALGRP